MHDATQPLTPSRLDEEGNEDGFEFKLTKLDKSPEQTPKQRRMQMQLLGQSMTSNEAPSSNGQDAFDQYDQRS